MIVTKTPLRISFFGGGSDIPQFYENNRGLVVSTTIDRYIYIAVNNTTTKHVKAMYSEIEVAPSAGSIKHNRIREILKYFNVEHGMEIGSFSDIPTKGTGLGSSSTFTVGLLKALLTYSEHDYSRYDLAELACEIEIDRCGELIGKQDQYAAAFGGFNAIAFEKDSTFVCPLNIPVHIKNDLLSNLMCFNTGITRLASSVLNQQVSNLSNSVNVDNTLKLVELAERSIPLITKGKLDEFGSLLHESWLLKKSLSDLVSNSTIDTMYKKAMNAGALGGKILGAGGGGYLLLYVPQQHQNKVARALDDYKQFYFNFTDVGSTVEMCG